MQPLNEPISRDGIFKLGQLAYHPGMTNKRLLRRVARTISRYARVEVVGVAAHERGTGEPAAMTHIVGPWSDEQSGLFGDWSRWLAEDACVSAGLCSAKRNRVHRLSELMGEDEYKSSKLYSEFMEPLNVVDQAFGIYRRADGSELLIASMALENTGPLTNEMLRQFTALAPYAAKSWAAAWRYEPSWVLTLKPTSMRVLECVMDGLDDEQISDRVGITYHAVRAHMKRLFREAGVRSRLHLMQEYRKQRAGLAGAMPAASQLNPDEGVVTVVDPADTAFGMVVPFSA